MLGFAGGMEPARGGGAIVEEEETAAEEEEEAEGTDGGGRVGAAGLFASKGPLLGLGGGILAGAFDAVGDNNWSREGTDPRDSKLNWGRSAGDSVGEDFPDFTGFLVAVLP